MSKVGWIIATGLVLVPFQNCSSGFKTVATAGSGSFASVGAGPPSAVVPGPIQGLNYRLTFEDTFTSLDSISLGPRGSGFKWFNGTEQCCMVDSTGMAAIMFPSVAANGDRVNPYALVPGGGLSIALIKKPTFWESGILTSIDADQHGFTQKYGYFEIRAKQPPGVGTWPAFWMLSTDPAMPGEIDIFEYYGNAAGGAYGITLHDWRNGGNNTNITEPSHFPPNSTLAQDYHVYGFLWTEAKLEFFLDGAKVWEHATPDVMKQPYYLLLNNGLGGYWPTDHTPSENFLLIDYVRAYAP